MDEIGWLPERDPDLVEAWSFAFDGTTYPDDIDRPILERSLLIARDDGGPGVCWLLYPDDATQGGERAAYEHSPGGEIPGGRSVDALWRARSRTHKMQP